MTGVRTWWLLLLSISCSGAASQGPYTPTWASLDARPLPAWYDRAKVGIFLHWGVFSVPAFDGAWFWQGWKDGTNKEVVDFMEKNYRPNFTYQDFGPMFTAEFFDPKEWASIFNASGAQYVVLTSKHHEGFTNWPSKVSWNWNAKDIGPKRDLVGELAAAIRKNQPHIHFGLYHSLFEWFNPLYLRDKSNHFSTSDFVKRKTMPELKELVEAYRPDVVWSDGDWEAPDWYWNSTEFIAWLFNESPVRDTVVVNDRWGDNVPCKHGSYYTCKDRFNPGTLQPHKWENCMTLDRQAWGYRRNAPATDYLTIHELLTTLAETVSCGGNLLVNAGPTHDGMIPPIMEERLRQLGLWLSVNGEAIYASVPWGVQNDTLAPGVWYTSKADTVYAILLTWPADDLLTLGSVSTTSATSITMIADANKKKLPYKQLSKGVQVALPQQAAVGSQWAWVLKMTGVTPAKLSPYDKKAQLNLDDDKENLVRKLYEKLGSYFETPLNPDDEEENFVKKLYEKLGSYFETPLNLDDDKENLVKKLYEKLGSYFETPLNPDDDKENFVKKLYEKLGSYF